MIYFPNAWLAGSVHVRPQSRPDGKLKIDPVILEISTGSERRRIVFGNFKQWNRNTGSLSRFTGLQAGQGIRRLNIDLNGDGGAFRAGLSVRMPEDTGVRLNRRCESSELV